MTQLYYPNCSEEFEDSLWRDCVDMNATIFDNVLPYLNLIDKLRDLGTELDDVSLPQIVVMGDQSSGKSSVLEALCGIEFPRGSGIVTRCPTEVKMKRAKSWRGRIRLSGDDSKGDEELDSPEAISSRIQELTEELTSNEKAIETTRSIQIEVYSPDLPDLTVIDLPGIVRRRMDGQAETVIQDVNDLLQRYLVQPRTVILAVIPSNVDIATVDIIERASNVDPQFKRTIGVFTKPDLMDSGHVMEKIRVLTGNEKSVQFSCAMLKNRGADEIKEGLSLSQAKKMETEFFKNHESFRTMDPALFGVDQFSRKLSVVLAGRIRESLPGLENDIMNKWMKATEELERLGEAPPNDKRLRIAIANNLLKKIGDDLRNSAERGEYTSRVLSKKPAARIYARFHTLASKCKLQLTERVPEWDVAELMACTAELRGRELPGFLSFNVFSVFVQHMVERWRPPVLELLESAAEVLMEACNIIIDFYTEKYKAMGNDLKQIVKDVILKRRNQSKTHACFTDLFESEMKPNTVSGLFMELQSAERVKVFKSFINDKLFPNDNRRKDIDRQEAMNIIVEAFSQTYALGSKTNEQKDAEVLKGTLEAYWKTKASPFVDRAIRTIDILLLDKLDDDIETEFRSLDHDSIFNNYFYESPHVAQSRLYLQQAIDRLTAAKSEFRNMGFKF